jgi:hypothetical protein
MPENDRGIGSEGLEQGGPDLGNDYTRSIGTRTDAGARDAVIVPKDDQQTERKNDTLNMDSESSRNLSGEMTDYEDEFEDEEDEGDEDMMEDDVLQGMDSDADADVDDDDDENDII